MKTTHTGRDLGDLCSRSDGPCALRDDHFKECAGACLFESDSDQAVLKRVSVNEHGGWGGGDIGAAQADLWATRVGKIQARQTVGDEAFIGVLGVEKEEVRADQRRLCAAIGLGLLWLLVLVAMLVLVLVLVSCGRGSIAARGAADERLPVPLTPVEGDRAVLLTYAEGADRQPRHGRQDELDGDLRRGHCGFDGAADDAHRRVP
jgi:hypothetical protein